MNLLYYDSMGMLSSKRMIENDSDGVFVRNLINKLILIWNKINYFKQFQYSLHLSPIFQRLCRLSSYKIVIIDLRNNHVSTFFVMVESINFRVFSRLSLVTETHTREAHPDNFKTSSFPSLSTLIRLSAPPPSQSFIYFSLSLIFPPWELRSLLVRLGRSSRSVFLSTIRIISESSWRLFLTSKNLRIDKYQDNLRVQKYGLGLNQIKK